MNQTILGVPSWIQIVNRTNIALSVVVVEVLVVGSKAAPTVTVAHGRHHPAATVRRFRDLANTTNIRNRTGDQTSDNNQGSNVQKMIDNGGNQNRNDNATNHNRRLIIFQQKIDTRGNQKTFMLMDNMAARLEAVRSGAKAPGGLP
jgi:hypothetical protein